MTIDRLFPIASSSQVKCSNNLTEICLLFCTWTMRGVLEKSQSEWTKMKRIERRKKYRFHCSWMLNRCVTFPKSKETHKRKRKQWRPTLNRPNCVCALFSCQLFIFTIYSIYLFCLSLSLYLVVVVIVVVVWAIQTQHISNLNFQSVSIHWVCSL